MPIPPPHTDLQYRLRVSWAEVRLRSELHRSAMFLLPFRLCYVCRQAPQPVPQCAHLGSEFECPSSAWGLLISALAHGRVAFAGHLHHSVTGSHTHVMIPD